MRVLMGSPVLQAIKDVIGPQEDIPAPDMNTGARTRIQTHMLAKRGSMFHAVCRGQTAIVERRSCQH